MLSCCSQETVERLGEPEQSKLHPRLLSIYNSKEKIPYAAKRGEHFYNFWQDAENKRGVWRRTTLASFRTPEPQWECVLSLDALNAHEGCADGEEFVWHGYSLLDEGLAGRWDRALVFLSPGGTDAQVAREFDLTTRQFVPRDEGGFRTEMAAKCDVGFRRRDEVNDGGRLHRYTPLRATCLRCTPPLRPRS